MVYEENMYIVRTILQRLRRRPQAAADLTAYDAWLEGFIVTYTERAYELGIPRETVSQMVHAAIAGSTPDDPPGVRLNRMIDEWQAENLAEEEPWTIKPNSY